MKYIIVLLTLSCLVSCNKQEYKYEIRCTISNGGRVVFTVGHKSRCGFNYWHKDVFRTIQEAEYCLNKYYSKNNKRGKNE